MLSSYAPRPHPPSPHPPHLHTPIGLHAKHLLGEAVKPQIHFEHSFTVQTAGRSGQLQNIHIYIYYIYIYISTPPTKSMIHFVLVRSREKWKRASSAWTMCGTPRLVQDNVLTGFLSSSRVRFDSGFMCFKATLQVHERTSCMILQIF